VRILADLGTHVAGDPAITQVDHAPLLDETFRTAINGKFAIPVPSGAEFNVDHESYILNGGVVDGDSVVAISMSHLLAAYPMYEFIYFNPLLTAANIDELDLSATFIPPGSSVGSDEFPTRVQTGRGVGVDSGQMPTHTALLAVNEGASPSRPGLLITEEIDISVATGGAGADEFMPWWKVYYFDITEDSNGYDSTNSPAIRYLKEGDQEPSGLSVYISVDDGATWCEVGLLETVAFAAPSTGFRLAFVNSGDSKLFLACFAVMF